MAAANKRQYYSKPTFVNYVLSISVTDYCVYKIQNIQAWCTIAAIAVEARAFELCSKAFIKLEAIDPDNFEKLAIEMFTRCKPKDVKGNKIDCPNCAASIPEWHASCASCDTVFPACAVSARALAAARAVRPCGHCGARALQHELVLRHACPVCHAPL